MGEDAAPRQLGCCDEPCRTCPYRRDVPAGLWDPVEYHKLIAYDVDTSSQPIGVFLCHYTNSDNPTLCRGWLAVGGWELLGVRLAVTTGHLDPAEVDRPIATDVFDTGTDAAMWGLSGVADPGPDAQAAIARLGHRRGNRTD